MGKKFGFLTFFRNDIFLQFLTKIIYFLAYNKEFMKKIVRNTIEAFDIFFLNSNFNFYNQNGPFAIENHTNFTLWADFSKSCHTEYFLK
jgi:hypothetical protein